MVTWLCPAKGQPAAEGLLRFLMRDDEPVFRFPPVKLEPAGRCSRIVDDIDTSGLEPGGYSYRLIWEPAGEGEPISAELPFRVGERKTEGP